MSVGTDLDLDQAMLDRYLVDGCSLMQIGREVGWSRETVRHHLDRRVAGSPHGSSGAAHRLRRAFNNERRVLLAEIQAVRA